ncbi:hypothetical protein FB565_008054 [Actinoplanes lutulentus]|uniref:Uncharacterized protein n=1 Tax=Actinoplanes lutulentus TaxID=1287878 RepID=A0A327ZCS4_9ACTN|nr:hypothetical protein [Actinoplanes lutulentus]MBB2948271.1 hypothetical protein [Actinoplanes lutulentus]RAK31232.1 hypothetical protein B0I29_11538 [Actinoplanes lutulentus]
MPVWITLVTTAVGALSATVGVLVGGWVTRRNQRQLWLLDKQLATYADLLGHYAKFSMVLKRAHADRSGWDYDWGAWSATLTSANLLAPPEVAARIHEFGVAVDEFLDRVARDSTTERPLSAEAFLEASQDAARAQLTLINEIRRSLGKSHGELAAAPGVDLIKDQNLGTSVRP